MSLPSSQSPQSSQSSQSFNSNPNFRGLPPLRGGSGSSSYKGGKGTLVPTTKLRNRNLLTAGILLCFVGTIYVTALRKMSQVNLFLIFHFLSYSLLILFLCY